MLTDTFVRIIIKRNWLDHRPWIQLNPSKYNLAMRTKVEASGLPCAKATPCKRHSRLIFDSESITPSGKSNLAAGI